MLGGDEALTQLLEGNRRFVAGQPRPPDQGLDRRAEVVAGQHPFAFVLGCLDSRVSHGLLFQQGLGDIFSSRTAGNLLDDAVIGGIEFGVEEPCVPQKVVLGHQRCGAVRATIGAFNTVGTAPGSIGRVVEVIRPAVELARSRSDDLLDDAVLANVQLGVARLRSSPAPPALLESGEV